MYLSFLRKLSMLSMVAALTFFISCNDEKKENTTEDSNETLSEKNVETPQSSTEASGSDVALNPAHGQPGHRCDIPVGEPLDGSGQQTQTNTQTQQSPVIQNSGSVPVNSDNNTNTNTNSDGAVNPPHGQPGHRCDIPVGAPLNN